MKFSKEKDLETIEEQSENEICLSIEEREESKVYSVGQIIQNEEEIKAFSAQ